MKEKGGKDLGEIECDPTPERCLEALSRRIRVIATAEATMPTRKEQRRGWPGF